MGLDLDQAAARIAARAGTGQLAAHLEDCYQISVAGLAELDLGVYRVDRRDGPPWVARLFPVARPARAADGDGLILRYLASRGFPAERCATAEPFSELDGQGLLVTEYVAPVPRAQRRQAVRDQGGLRALGELLGRLHALPAGPPGGATGAALARGGGGWHHLVEGRPQDEVAAARALVADAASLVPAPGRRDYDTVRRALDAADGGEGLPEALTHPDFVLANVIASPGRGLVPVDWTGAGRGPRAWSLAWLLFAEGARGLGRVDLVVAGYRRHVRPEPGELARLAAMAPVRMTVLDAWSFCLRRKPLAAAARGAGESRELAAAVAARAGAAFRAS